MCSVYGMCGRSWYRLGCGALTALAVACTSVAPPEPEPCDVEPVALPLPGQCWEDAELCPPEEALELATCTRRYVCDVPQPDGVDRPACVRAIDCECMRSVAAECDADFEMPRLCSFR